MTSGRVQRVYRMAQRENLSETAQENAKQDDELWWSFKTQFQNRKIPQTESFFLRRYVVRRNVKGDKNCTMRNK